ncbi:hypothetical protein GF402_08425 [Candidatus Fermentibacteria bacterium]|nr:hypothetical protein [Candidatus Fermentibacteria bacterium]
MRYSVCIRLALPVVLILCGCIDSPATTEPPNPYASELELLWELFDGEYAGFRTSGVDWQGVLQSYLPLADTVSSEEGMTYLMSDLLGELSDPSVVLISPQGDTLRPFDPSAEQNCDLDLLLGYLEPWDFQWRQEGIWGFCLAGEDSAGYVVFESWDAGLNVSLFDNLLQTVPVEPGLIIDARLCGGGVESSVYKVVRRFVDVQRAGYLWRERQGAGTQDLTDPEPFWMVPRPWRYQGEVVVLSGGANRGQAEAFPCMMGQLPQVTVIGDTTLGAGNWPADTFELTGDRQALCPVRVVLRPDSEAIQGAGVPPDLYVEATEDDFSQGIDPVLEEAFELLDARPPDRPR